MEYRNPEQELKEFIESWQRFLPEAGYDCGELLADDKKLIHLLSCRLFALHLNPDQVRFWDRGSLSEWIAADIYQETRPDNYRSADDNTKAAMLPAFAFSFSAGLAWRRQLYPDETLEQLNKIYYCLRKERTRSLTTTDDPHDIASRLRPIIDEFLPPKVVADWFSKKPEDMKGREHDDWCMEAMWILSSLAPH